VYVVRLNESITKKVLKMNLYFCLEKAQEEDRDQISHAEARKNRGRN
jgi:hypothetical protein